LLDIPISVLITVIVFVIFLAALFLIFGTPQCDSMANQTAYSLKIAMDNVALDSFPMWDGDDVPSDSDYAYYQTASIRLCQEQGTTFWDSFFGRPPEYQIYYEIFPEGGWSWNEAYPWSGGAAGTLKFWAAMRIGTGIWKLGSKLYYSRAALLGTAANMGKAGFDIAKEKILKTQLEEVLESLQKYSDDAVEAVSTTARRPAEILTEIRKLYEADQLYDTMRRLGYITDEVDETGRFILKDEDIIMKIPIKNVDGTTTEEVLYVLKENGDITDMATLDKWNGDLSAARDAGFEEFKASPREIYEDYLDSISEGQRAALEEQFALTPKGIKQNILDIPDKLKGTSWYQKNFQPVVDKMKSYIKRLDTAGLDVNNVNTNGKGIIFGVEAILQDNNVGEYWYQKIIKDESLVGKIKSTLRLASKEEVTRENVYRYLAMIGENFNGYVFIPKELKWRINEVAINVLSKNLDDSVQLTGEGLKSAIKNFADVEAPDLIEDLAGGDAQRFYSIVDDVVDKEVAGHTASFFASKDKTLLTRDVFVSHMGNAKNLIDAGDEEGLKELGLMLGTVEQNKNSLPLTYESIGVEGVKANFKKVVYLDVSSIANPGSWYAQGFFATRALEGCQGNSICLLAKNSPETPLYLNKEADSYDIRVWRPVEMWQQFAGLQAAIMHVPSNPRFYVVSPCFAIAKVWKTTYDGVDTIFVLPEKIETENSSNYCYADSDLINQYTAIWAISDILDFMPWSRALSALGLSADLGEKAFKIGSKTVSTVGGLVDEIVGIADPATLLQGILEGVVSWPGAPWSPLAYDQMVTAQQNVPKGQFGEE
jgi:hypothetical protein